MATLEEEGLIEKPHTSAGRVPTDRGYRMYVDEMADYEEAQKRAKRDIVRIKKEYAIQKTREKLYDIVAILAHASENVSFATLPGERTFYLGLSNILRQPEFVFDAMRASQVIEVLERENRLINLLKNLPIKETPKIFIGSENILKEIQSCSIIVAAYTLGAYHGFYGILGPKRMDYPYNAALVSEARNMLN